jgi:hypothetical protein
MTTKLRVAIGPENPSFGSWQWVGMSLITALKAKFETVVFSNAELVNDCSIIVFIKFLPTFERLKTLSKDSVLVYVPIDRYGSAAEIDDDRESLGLFRSVLLHSPRLMRYLHPYCLPTYVDHPLCYALQEPRRWVDTGPLLWAGRRCNVEPVAAWVNTQQLKMPVLVLTEGDDSLPSPQELGFSDDNDVRTIRWSPQVHVKLIESALAAVDIKGSDFRSRHKPPAKMFDFLASGVPVITNRGSSSFLVAANHGLSILKADCWTDDLRELDRGGFRAQAAALCEALNPGRISDFLIQHFLQLIKSNGERVSRTLTKGAI